MGSKRVMILCCVVIFAWCCRFWYNDGDAVRVHAHNPHGLDGFFLYHHELDQLQDGTLRSMWNQRLRDIISDDPREKTRLINGLQNIEQLKEHSFWHHRCITTGLYGEKPCYPYIPHMFSLWQLAPGKGKGATVVLIDTGVAGFTIQERAHQIKHAHILSAYQWPANDTIIDPQGNLNPLYHTMSCIEQHSEHTLHATDDIEKKLSEAILYFLETDDDTPLQKICASCFNGHLITSDGKLSEAGNVIFRDILYGPYGIMPQGKREASPFIVGTVTQPCTQRVLLNNIPMPFRSSALTTYIAGHGTHAYGQVMSIAPRAHIRMIKAFDDEGGTRKSHLARALGKAHTYGADIVNLSLKIGDTLDTTEASTQELESLIAKLPYVVCSSGNDGDPAQASYKGDYLSYPARSRAVRWTIGSFRQEADSFPASSFSQSEDKRGPLFLAPGEDILSTGIVPEDHDPTTYVFMSGTSMAATLASGFLALVHAEFGSEFSVDQIAYVCQKSGFFLHDTQVWKKKSLYGALDMRTALFILHVMRALKKIDAAYVERMFTKSVDAVSDMLCKDAQAYADTALLERPFKTALADYIQDARMCKENYVMENFFPASISDTLEDAIAYSVKKVIQVLTVK
jgi:hypothetical protein